MIKVTINGFGHTPNTKINFVRGKSTGL